MCQEVVCMCVHVVCVCVCVAVVYVCAPGWYLGVNVCGGGCAVWSVC